MIEFKYDVPMGQFFNEESGLCQLHWEEIALNRTTVKLAPDVKRYKQLQELDILRNIVVYADGLIVGYSIILVQPHLHYKDNLYGYVDVLYLDPCYRNGRLGIKLVNETEVFAKRVGVEILLHHTKPHHPSLEKILIRKGYSLNERIYGKRVKE